MVNRTVVEGSQIPVLRYNLRYFNFSFIAEHSKKFVSLSSNGTQEVSIVHFISASANR